MSIFKKSKHPDANFVKPLNPVEQARADQLSIPTAEAYRNRQKLARKLGAALVASIATVGAWAGTHDAGEVDQRSRAGDMADQERVVNDPENPIFNGELSNQANNDAAVDQAETGTYIAKPGDNYREISQQIVAATGGNQDPRNIQQRLVEVNGGATNLLPGEAVHGIPREVDADPSTPQIEFPSADQNK